MIIKEKIDEAFEQFLEITEKINEDLNDEISLLSARFNITQREYEQGVITRSDYELVYAQTSKSLLNFVKNLPK